MEPFQFPYRSKERGEVWNEIASNLNGLVELKFKVTKRSVRDRLTLLQEKYKAKMRQEERASGIDCEETELDIALEEILEKEKVAEDLKDASYGKKKAEKAAAEEHRQQACERLGETKRRNTCTGSTETDDGPSKPKKSRKSSSDAVEYLREKSERESEWKKQELELRAKEQEANIDLQKQQLDMMKAFMQQQQ